ncbi:hypothetical protein KP509_03G010700 [Ceratopteris richardii]|uniref:Amidase domain-containing protein n=1 Tax=Ceratopteris richardii TaxID=49495 RepID=A0A8T2UX44_CERRI|nr:hypothetical protein KP509_03G010700 [Ceratopteris richardii]KAH7440790.1 hypothetical protein KP509_03G010700 [Ceratopteris richardii]KAH7440791.1 hypothetical protein KP509_03G010700 [Ceratopteris richardii]KAH7440792.1 hypothetical protein KP509_03G010700 [Ceratopteris richardii]KAH7440793.1 hypothetical protein KP509_03G010700 [Ceratopteris richardii]
MVVKTLPPVEDLDIDAVKYDRTILQAPHFTGYALKISTWLLESRLFGNIIISSMLRANKFTELLSETEIPDAPMLTPEFSAQAYVEPGVKTVGESSSPMERVEVALSCLPSNFNKRSDIPFKYWCIRDYAKAYRLRSITPSDVAEHLISAIEDSQCRDLPLGLFISLDAEDIRKQAAESTRRFDEGNPLSVLDGVFMAVKDEIDCLPYGTRGGTTWFHKVRDVKKDAVCVARLRSCGIIFIGKTNQHELGSGTTGLNPHYGPARNPHDPRRYTGGSSAGSAALVACGLCPAALGTDGGGSVRIPSALCGIVGLKSTHGRISLEGVLELGWTVEVVSPMAGSVEDLMLVYAAMLGSQPGDVSVSKPTLPSFPILENSQHDLDIMKAIGSITFGKYTQWFEDVSNPELLEVYEHIIEQFKETYGIKVKEVVLPELDAMRRAHTVTIGSEIATAINTYYLQGKRKSLSYEIRNTVALFRSFRSTDYVTAQRVRRRSMLYHMEAFKSVDVIVTPTTPMTAPVIPKSAVTKIGESNLVFSGDLMRFTLAPNFLGFPAITVPVGFDSEGLPVGLQFIGRPWSEATLIRLAAAAENLCASRKRRPAVFYDLLKAS